MMNKGNTEINGLLEICVLLLFFNDVFSYFFLYYKTNVIHQIHKIGLEIKKYQEMCHVVKSTINFCKTREFN